MPDYPFIKAHGCGNDFLLIMAEISTAPDPRHLVRGICDRHFGVGADGVYFVSVGPTAEEIDATVLLYNADGSKAELSGNGTRCVAAMLVEDEVVTGKEPVRIRTGAGIMELRLLGRDGRRFRFEMRVGPARIEPGPDGALDVNVGNPQCVVFVEDFSFDWPARGRGLEKDPHYPHGANVDFVRTVDRHTIEARFWERGAGHTLASGTGSSASAVAAIHAGRAESPVTVRTEGGELNVRWESGEDVFLIGPAEIVARGSYYFE